MFEGYTEPTLQTKSSDLMILFLKENMEKRKKTSKSNSFMPLFPLLHFPYYFPTHHLYLQQVSPIRSFQQLALQQQTFLQLSTFSPTLQATNTLSTIFKQTTYFQAILQTTEQSSPFLNQLHKVPLLKILHQKYTPHKVPSIEVATTIQIPTTSTLQTTTQSPSTQTPHMFLPSSKLSKLCSECSSF